MVAALLTAAALVLCLRFPNPTPQFDEFYHLLAARSLLHDGDLTINDGARPYTRAALFTYAVAASQSVFGETITAARVPSALTGALLVGAVFLWVRRRAGWLAALLSAGTVMLTLHPLNYATMVRFYTPHALLVFLAAISAFEVLDRWRQQGIKPASREKCWWSWWALGVASALLALHLQFTTLIAAAAVSVWGLVLCVRWWIKQDNTLKLRSAAAALGAVVAIFLLLWGVGVLDALLAVYRRPRMWSAHTATDLAFYHRLLTNWYAPLWWGLPIWVALGWRRHREVVGFCLVFFLVTVGLHSLMAVKADRYVLYALPMLFVIVGIGAGECSTFVWRYVQVRFVSLDAPPIQRFAVCSLVVLALTCAGGYVWYRTPAGPRAVQLLAGQLHRNPFARTDWNAAAPTLRPFLERADIAVTSAGIKSLYYFDRLDAALSHQGKQQLTTDTQTPTVLSETLGDADDLAAVREQHRCGVVAIEDEHWRHPAFVTDATADWIETNLTTVPITRAARLRVFTWGMDDRTAMADDAIQPNNPHDPPRQGP